MNRRAALGLVTGLVALPGLTGCLTDGGGTVARVEKFLGWDDPKAPKFSPASVQTARRVDELGHRIIAQNTFTGLDPLFHCVHVPESVLFHRGSAELYVSDGLVAQCKNDAELAAVLCAELGHMMAEKGHARRLGRDESTIPDVALPGGGTAGFDGTRAAELAAQQRTARPLPAEPADATKVAKDLLHGAGFDPAELDRVEPLLKQTDRAGALRKQMAGSAPAPTWEK